MRITRGFTLIELLVVMAVVALLMALLLPALRQARQTAQLSQTMSHSRQLLTGYDLYQFDHNGAVLYGYAPASVKGEPQVVQVNGQTYGAPVANRYPWRLSPYLPNIWSLLYHHIEMPRLPRNASEDAMFLWAYELSVMPAFGLNAVYVGGYDGPVYRGFDHDGVTAHPRVGGGIVFNSIEVRRPSQLIVFAESQLHGMLSTAEQTGYHWATAPHAVGEHWRARDGGIEVTSGSIIGVPRGRQLNLTTTGFFDGHVQAMSPQELDDMRLWSNIADDVNWDLH